MLKVCFFGPPEVRFGNTSIHQITASPTLAQLFAYCVTYRHQPHTREKLATLLWPDLPEARARRNLNNAIWELRQAFKLAQAQPDAYWLSDSQTVQFNSIAPIKVDVTEFESANQLLLQLDAHPPHKVLLHLEHAVSLYRGDFLEGLYADWCAPLREQFREAYLVLLETLTRHYQNSGRTQDALLAAQKLAQADPLREEAHFQLIQLYAASKRLPEANAQYEQYAALWRKELHATPSARMETLARQINSANVSAAQLFADEVLAHNVEIVKTLAALLRQYPPAAKQADPSAWSSVAERSERAGRQLKTRSANAEALQYFAVAIEALANLPTSQQREKRELSIRRECDELYDLSADTDLQRANLQSAIRLAEKLNDPAERADILARQAWLSRRQGQHQQAIGALQEMLAVCKASSAQTYAALAYRLLGILYDELGDFRAALDQHTQAFKSDKRLNQRQGLYLDHINLSSVLTGMGHYSKAMSHLEKAAALAESESHRLTEVTIAGNRGNLWLKLGQFELANEQIQHALKLVRQTGDRETECWLGGRLAYLYHRQNSTHPALQLAYHYYRSAVEIQTPRRAAELADVLASVYIGLSEGANALEWATIATELSRKHNLRRYQLRGLMRQAQGLGLTENQRSALKKIRAAVTLFEDWSQPLEEETELFWILAECAQANDNPQVAALAEARAHMALQTVARRHVAPKWRKTFLKNHPVQFG